MSLAVSTRKVDITPPANGLLAGYGVDEPRRAEATRKTLYARCTIIWDDGWPNIIVTVDVLGFSNDHGNDIRAAVSTATGVGASDFVLLATHTHNGPALKQRLEPFISYGATSADISAIETYSTALKNTIVQLVQATMAAVQVPCTLDYKVTSQSFSANRSGLTYNETVVPILVARGTAGTPLAILFSYGCHPVAAGQQFQYDPDYPGGAAERIETAIPGVHAQFIPGPAGDQDPTGTRGWALRDQDGLSLGNAVISAVATAGRAVGGPINTDFRNVTIPLDITPTPANMQQVRAHFVTRSTSGPSPWHKRHGQVMVQQIDSNTFAQSVVVPMQVWKLSGNPSLRIAFNGGEVVSGFAVYFRGQYSGGNANKLWFGAYANAIPAYIPSDELMRRGTQGSYEGGYDGDFPGIGGGAMTVYACVAHFKYRAAGTSTNGVEQIFISNLTSMLGAP
jgi:neutral ceramidase